jgi:hypothetical protein
MAVTEAFQGQLLSQALWGVRLPAERVSPSPEVPFESIWSYSCTVLSRGFDPLSPFGQVKQTFAISSDIDSLLRKWHHSGIHMSAPQRIRDYLFRFPDMLETAERAIYITQKYLLGAQLWLEVYQDPEIDDEHLVIYARFKKYDKSTLEKIELVRKEYRPFLIGKSGWLILTTDFKELE